MKTILSLFVSLSAVMNSGLAFSSELISVKLSSSENLYCLKSKTSVLSKVTKLKANTTVKIPKNAFPQILPLESGQRDTTGFYPNVEVQGISFPSYCKSSEGFFITGAIPLGSTSGPIPALPLNEKADSRFVEYYEATTGKVKYSRVKRALAKNKVRFSSVWNKEYKRGDISDEEFVKGQKILEQLREFADRTTQTRSSLVYLNKRSRLDARTLAEQLSIQTINNYGFSPSYGAWDVAIFGTAKRLGFGHAPCAEFMSEVIRQAYTRAGYSHDEDFSSDVNDRLIFTWDDGEVTWGPQSVRGLSERMAKAGWSAWDPTIYKPTTGAIAMAWYATTPGHTYIIAGKNGSMIVDNGNPKGLDLKVTTKRHKKNHLKNMYVHGVFFLPKGIKPTKW